MVTELTEAQRIETAVNLKRQVAALADVNDSEFIFQDTSPPVRWQTVYSMTTGEPIQVKHFRVEATLLKTLPDGSPAFTAYQEQAPEYRLGNTRCFLAADSAERAAGILAEIGMEGKTCNGIHLANEFAKEMHAQHKHKAEWTVFKAYKERQEKEAEIARQQAQTDAMLAMAAPRRRGAD